MTLLNLMKRLIFFHTPGWDSYIETSSKEWLDHGLSWLKSDKELFVMEYDDMNKDIRILLQRACDFVHLQTNESILECVLDNQEGSYHRPKSNNSELLVFPEEKAQRLRLYQDHIKWFLDRRCPDRPHCLPLNQLKPSTFRR